MPTQRTDKRRIEQVLTQTQTGRHAAVSWEDRRREPRVEAEGEVHLYIRELDGMPVHAHLVDVSASGFRAAHDSVDIRAGVEVDFAHPRGEGRARVMWNRMMDGRWESGFVVVE